MITVIAFVVALGLLIAVHEYGHYRMAIAYGVKVLRFSIGFGRPILKWTKAGSSTEFTIGLLPLGGYVRMLDEREGPVEPDERHLAFNTQPLSARAAIVAAGPLANLLLAATLYAAVNWIGMEEPEAVLGAPVAGSLAADAGLVGGEQVWEIAAGQEAAVPVRSFEDLRWRLTQAALGGEDVRLKVSRSKDGPVNEVGLSLSQIDVREADAGMFQRIGILFPWSEPVMGEVVAGGAAQAAGLLPGDHVLSVDGKRVSDGASLRQMIRSAVDVQGHTSTQSWEIARDGQTRRVVVTPRPEKAGSAWIGRIGAFVGGAPTMTTVRYGLFDGLRLGVQRTGEVAWLTLKMMGKMVVGQASLKNISGPLTIADYAGKSASMGVTAYLVFLALISVSLGVLNLLPLPVLDGGHLMYYLWEGFTGRSVSEVWLERLQRGGVAVLLALMCVALFNDISRLVG
ncbi:MAG: RIP metalloprotease RseP [Hydrogenophaga sp.]|nr:RIP metalloprotease RseP [Hydrogenophaga sp.]